jgi:hypothetical protein
MEENLRIVYKNNEGVRVVIPAEGQDVEELVEKSVPNGAEYKVIKISEIPTDRDFRGAWEYMSGVKVNIEKAKDIQRNRWRAIRGPLLQGLDVEFLMASENEDLGQIDIIKQKKRILRDVTLTDLSSVNSLEELKDIWPECLLSKE